MNTYDKVTDPDLLASLSFDNGYKEPDEYEIVTDRTLLSSLEDRFSLEIDSVRNQELRDLVDPQPEDPKTWADWISPLLEVGSAMAVVGPATTKGAALGTPFGPVGIAAGGLAAGVAASSAVVYASRFAGEGAEALIEGREFNPDKAMQEAMDAAQTDALFSTAFGVAFPAVSKSYGAGKTLLKNKSMLSEAQKKVIVELQQKLKTYNASLLPSMVKPDSKVAEVLTSIAKVSQVTKSTVNKYLDSYGTYMGDQTEQLLLKFKAGGPTKQGELLQGLIAQTDQALREIVDPLYKNIDALGKRVTVRAEEDAVDLAGQLKTRYRAKTTYNKKGEPIENFEYPTSGTKKAVEYLETLPNDLNFFEAHKRLSDVKARLSKATTSTTQDPDRIRVLGATADLLKDSMDDAAERLSPALKKEYKEVTEMYSKGKAVVTGTYLKKALEVNDPVEIGAMLTSDGLTYGIKEIKQLKKLAAEYKAKLPKDSKIKGLDVDPMEGIRKGFLAQILKVGPEESIQSFQRLRTKLSDPRFKETFDALFEGTSSKKKIDSLFEELAILERVQSGGAGFQLAVAGREYGAVSNPKVGILFRSFIPSFLANRAIASKNIDKVINLIKTAKTTSNKGIPLPKGYEARLQQLLTGQKVGLGLGALANESN